MRNAIVDHDAMALLAAQSRVRAVVRRVLWRDFPADASPALVELVSAAVFKELTGGGSPAPAGESCGGSCGRGACAACGRGSCERGACAECGRGSCKSGGGCGKQKGCESG